MNARIKVISFSLVVAALVAVSPAALASGAACNGAGNIDYTVRKGDTLWDISGSHMKDPFLWQEIWKENPGIKDPDLIFPGERIKIPCPAKPGAPGETAMPAGPSAAAEAKEGPFVERGKTVVKKRVEESKVIQLEAGGQKAPIAETADILNAGFIMADMDGVLRIIGAPMENRDMYVYGDQVYVEAAPDLKEGVRLMAVRPEDDVEDPVNGRDIGTLVKVTGLLEIKEKKDRLFLCSVVRSFDGIKSSDPLVAYKEPALAYEPVPKNGKLEGKWGYIVASKESRKVSALLSVVYLDLGTDDGVAPGDRFVIRRSGGVVTLKDKILYVIPKRYVTPDVEVGEVQVIAVQPGSSTARVTGFKEPVRSGYRVYYKD